MSCLINNASVNNVIIFLKCFFLVQKTNWNQTNLVALSRTKTDIYLVNQQFNIGGIRFKNIKHHYKENPNQSIKFSPLSSRRIDADFNINIMVSLSFYNQKPINDLLWILLIESGSCQRNKTNFM